VKHTPNPDQQNPLTLTIATTTMKQRTVNSQKQNDEFMNSSARSLSRSLASSGTSEMAATKGSHSNTAI